MKLELGKFEICDIQFAEKSYIEGHVLYVNKAEEEKKISAVLFHAPTNRIK